MGGSARAPLLGLLLPGERSGRHAGHLDVLGSLDTDNKLSNKLLKKSFKLRGGA